MSRIRCSGTVADLSASQRHDILICAQCVPLDSSVVKFSEVWYDLVKYSICVSWSAGLACSKTMERYLTIELPLRMMPYSYDTLCYAMAQHTH